MRLLNIGAAILVIIAIAGLPAASFAYRSLHESGFDGTVIDLTGSNGAWNHQEIKVRQGERVRLRITSHDVVHGFTLEAMGIEIDEVYPGKVTEVDFSADEAGSFLFTCTILCSGDHRDMRGTLIVEAA